MHFIEINLISPPIYFHNTRKSRAFENFHVPHKNMSYIEKKTEINGTMEIHIKYIFPEKYIPIKEFMEYHFIRLSDFFEEFINALIKMKFKII